MQNETLRGNTPAAAPGAIARDVRLCLACLHENRSGEQSCEVCGTSLYLILCGACEAVNGPGALRCHGCGAALGTEGSDKPAVAPPAGRTSLARTEASDKRAAASPARRINRARLALSLAALAAVAALAYQYVPRTAPAERSQEGRIVKSAPVESSEPPARAELPSEPPARTQVPSKPPARAQLPSTQGNAAASAAGSSGSVGSEPKASRTYAPVTHTRPGDSSWTPPAAAVVPAAPDAGQNSEARCSEEVSALGLCSISSVKRGGK